MKCFATVPEYPGQIQAWESYIGIYKRPEKSCYLYTNIYNQAHRNPENTTGIIRHLQEYYRNNPQNTANTTGLIRNLQELSARYRKYYM